MIIDTVVVGGGIVGLFSAYFHKLKFPEKEIALFESSPFLGEGNTSRNSGVLHAGLYYETGSNKHKFCLEGNKLWQKLGRELSVEVKVCGKYLVASSKKEILKLEELFTKAKRNNVEGIDWVEAGELSNFVNVEKCFFSKNTGIIDVPEAIKQLEKKIVNMGVHIFLNNPVTDIKQVDSVFQITSKRETFKAMSVVNAAGFGGVKIRNMLGLTNFTDSFVKGNYLNLKGPYYNKSLIYPVPSDDAVGLGVHTTMNFTGEIRFGPNSEKVKTYDYKMGDSLIDEMWPAINSLFKKVKKENLELGYSGVRTKLLKDGEVYNDFVVDEPIPNYFEAIGIESPGLTSAPAIAKYIVSLFS